MSILRPNLGKLIKFYSHSDKELIFDIKKDIELEFKHADALQGLCEYPLPIPYYRAFWSRAKRHVYGYKDLNKALNEFFKEFPSSYKKREPYNRAANQFLKWYDEKRRWRNEDFTEDKSKYTFTSFHLGQENPIKLKNEDFLAIKLNNEQKKIIYSCFSPRTMISSEGARIALWIMQEAFPNVPANSFRFFDVLHARSYGLIDYQLIGNEKQLLSSRYKLILNAYEIERNKQLEKREAA
ncbi:hypothetical protein [Curvivirga sp.]|uniref:hypothetical protein n=1 Tax=Curvivirga sp. TaxID=2856848 RepID=UPI003B5B17AA